MSDAEYFGKLRAQLVETISGSDSITQEAKNSLRKNHSLAAFIDLMSNQGFRDWYETDFIDYLCGDNEVSLTDIIEFCNSNFKG